MTSPIENKSHQKTVKLAVPMDINGERCESLVLTKPNAGHLRGLTLVDVCQMDFAAGEKLLPKISTLNERDVLNIEIENWAPILVAIASFFVNTEQ
ncbi:phage tail assembly protein [Vibrio sp. 10N.261.46.A3]|uniref:phage tail assembly protein n=1 Tax=Vibrio sp. 10N.261.46.A3 TaxID=3229658 RepID=UPI00354F9EE1